MSLRTAAGLWAVHIKSEVESQIPGLRYLRRGKPSLPVHVGKSLEHHSLCPGSNACPLFVLFWNLPLQVLETCQTGNSLLEEKTELLGTGMCQKRF